MKLLSAAQMKEWDKYTIHKEPISSIDLMEKASKACFNWLESNTDAKTFFVFCGYGNNGGDGLAIARLLSRLDVQVRALILDDGGTYSNDFNINLERLKSIFTVPITWLKPDTELPHIPEHALIIDAIFGTGLNRPLDGLSEKLVNYINSLPNRVISIDMPSGLLCDSSSKNYTAIKADDTLTFQCLKKAFLIPENEENFGKVHILNIGLHPGYLDTVESKFELIDKTLVQSFYKPRRAFAHKGSFGHALIVAGSFGKMGAAILCTRACLRSGVGLVTAHVPQKGIDTIQTSTPEAMCKIDNSGDIVSEIDYDLGMYSAIGIGPGIGKEQDTANLLFGLLQNYKKPMVLDADALNILSVNRDWFSLLPENTILTPHPVEFTRLFDETMDDFEKTEIALQKARELNAVILLKGHYTLIATPSGKGYFNTTGNAGMAKGGSGDILTGILTGLLAQGYTSEQATIMGVYIHGLAGDRAAEKYGMDAMISGDLVEEMKHAFL
ncbi:NAD(P)H-hydrate dehydratase [Niabella aquatica]